MKICSLFSIQKNFPVNRKDLRALTLMGLTWENPVPDPLAVKHLNNQLYIWIVYLNPPWAFLLRTKKTIFLQNSLTKYFLNPENTFCICIGLFCKENKVFVLILWLNYKHELNFYFLTFVSVMISQPMLNIFNFTKNNI